jgi:hypothetical protein
MKLNPRVTFALLLIMTAALVTLGSGRQTGPDGHAKLKQVEGDVEVNGTAAISGATVFSDSTITTAARSSAVVSLAKLGRVEVLPESKMMLSFDDSSVTVAVLDAGRVRVSSSSNATAITRDAVITGLGRGRNDFTVDTSCGNTFVAVRTGRVELRAGNSVKQIAAGGQDTAGTAVPGCVPEQ